MNTQNAHADTPPGVSVDLFERDRRVHDLQQSIGRAVRELRVARGINQTDMARLAGMHGNTLSKIERGEALCDVRQLFELSLALDVPMASLLAGFLGRIDSDADQIAKADLVLVPGYSPHPGVAQETYAFSRAWIARKGYSLDHLVVVIGSGDSMDPTVRDGDIQLVDRSVQRIAGDGIYMLVKAGELYGKRLQRLFDGGVSIMSDNKRYEAQHLPPEAADKLKLLGRVVWIGGER